MKWPPINKSFWNTLLHISLPIYVLVIAILLYISLIELESKKSENDLIRANQIQENQTVVETVLDQITSDLNYIAEIPAIINFYSNPEKNSGAVAEQLKSFVTNKKCYLQIRLIDTLGWEKVRVDYSEHRAEICSASKLQLKNSRYYFKEMRNTDSGAIYISPLDLNIEHGEIEEPIVPVLRIAKLVRDPSSGKSIYVIMNYLGNVMLERMTSSSQLGVCQSLLINAHGYYLQGPSPNEEWRFMYSDTTRGLFSHQFPIEWEEISGNNTADQIKSDKGYFTYLRINFCNYFSGRSENKPVENTPLSSEEWILVCHADHNSIINNIYIPVFRKYLIMALFSGIILLFFTVLYMKLRTSQITERTRTKKHFSFMQSLIETIPNPIFFIDYLNDEFGCNEAFVTLMGKPKAELKNLGIEKLFHGSEKYKSNDKAIKGDVKVSELKLKYPDGSIHNLHYNKAQIIVDQEKIGFVGVYTDVTSIRRAELALRESELNLKAANRTKNRFFSLIAHDLKNPFHSIMGLSHLLSSNYASLPDTDRLHLAKNIFLSSERTYQLLVNLLDWARLQEGKINTKPISMSIVKLVTDNINLHNEGIKEKKLKVSVDIDSSLKAYADENMVRTVIRNLLSNAIKFTDREGEIRIEAGKKGEDTEVCICDTGIGISSEEIESLFDIEKSGRANNESDNKGTGFGLVLCKDFIELNGGRLWVESEIGKGSSFYFSLPSGKESIA